VTLSWGDYLFTINHSDTFVTRYFHYLRLLTIRDYLQREISPPENKKCLDIGCSRGYFSKMVADIGFSVDAIDRNLDLPNIIPHPNIHYVKTDIESFSPKGKYDLILFFEVFEHIPVEKREMVLDKIHNLLADGGILLLSAPNCLSFLYGGGYCKEKAINFFEGTTNLNWHYHIPFFSMIDTLKSSGFEVKQWSTDGVLPVVSDRIEQPLGRLVPYLVRIDKTISKFLNGFGANYYCLAQKKVISSYLFLPK